MRAKDLFNFIRERHRIYERRAKGAPKPWTKDPILRAYRFCNVYRELDTVTQWIDENWRRPHKEDNHVWFAMAVARLVNWPDTLAELGPALTLAGSCIDWKPEKFLKTMHGRAGCGGKVFSGAYIVSTNGHAMDKAEYLVQHVLNPLWKDRKYVRPTMVDTLDRFHKRLCEYNGMGSFMAAQVVADVKYVSPLRHADDWWTWAASGPGSRRGLNRVCNLPVDQSWSEKEWRSALFHLALDISRMTTQCGMQPLHAQDLQNCLCEFDKYERTRLNEGRPRSTYPGI